MTPTLTWPATAVVRDALRGPLEAPDAFALLLFTSDWAAPAESAALALLRAAGGEQPSASGALEGDHVRVAVLRQRLQPLETGDSSDIDTLETAVANECVQCPSYSECTVMRD